MHFKLIFCLYSIEFESRNINIEWNEKVFFFLNNNKSKNEQRFIFRIKNYNKLLSNRELKVII